MTGRDRIVIVLVVVAVALVAVWLEVVSPERQQASRLVAEVAAARTQLEGAEGQVSHARAARSQYAAAYAAMVNLGKAVPPSQEVPALIDQITQASEQKSVDFESITNGGGSSSSAPTRSAGASGAAASAGLSALPFTFTFEGSYFNLERLLRRLTSFATLNGSGDIEVSGRLLTIQSVSLSPGSGGSTASGTSSTGALTGSITASAYVLPASQGLTGSASAASPSSPAASSASSAAASSSSPAPAIVKVNP